MTGFTDKWRMKRKNGDKWKEMGRLLYKRYDLWVALFCGCGTGHTSASISFLMVTTVSYSWYRRAVA
ncbi:hypothetical protein BS47DRAFT_1345359 [Hydnum rufescens UP504]|uniref:Uncharacterized protein n=1 Tax=Hydnum rufescens UP504 TaxID=1448309 RepID=A0A9P6AUY7_9AGAM|nr:hypothetical protein BS47DRAFT_1345359 [Hydnum rufescens UP504]